jgi:transposase
MPRKGEFKAKGKKQKQHTSAQVEGFVKRYMAGEPVETLIKDADRSRAAFYLWVNKYKTDMLEQSRRGEMSDKELEKVDKSKLIAQLQALKLENTKLRNKVVSLMIRAGDL